MNLKYLLLNILIIAPIINAAQQAKITYYNGPDCKGAITQYEYYDTCSSIGRIQINATHLVSYSTTNLDAINPQCTGYDFVVAEIPLKTCIRSGESESYYTEVYDSSVVSLYATQEKGFCSQYMYSGNKCVSNFYVTSTVNGLCKPSMEEPNKYILLNCSSTKLFSYKCSNDQCSKDCVLTNEEEEQPCREKTKNVYYELKGLISDPTTTPQVTPAPVHSDEQPQEKPVVDSQQQDPNNGNKVTISVSFIIMSLLFSFVFLF
ncbi:hypothetical protein CYY_000456 [Polysphondylium violaceum]|uniref:Transmembrane protein n=1 Tax=Polysphondylium violaceum TaxID=133409 RepID=A0A8J4QAY0_9MYCE|nr:hypothetical protein CYY_000456 [Polysphondylium violaceum]